MSVDQQLSYQFSQKWLMGFSEILQIKGGKLTEPNFSEKFSFMRKGPKITPKYGFGLLLKN